MMAWIRPRTRTLLYWGVAVATPLCVLLNVEKREEFCTLCGKQRTVWAVRLPRLRIGMKERPSGFSRTLEPVVHGDGEPHLWHVYRRSLLRRTWDAL